MDLTSIKTIREIQRRFDFHFSKGFGQNFLTDPNVLDIIADAADVTNGVLEIGPGFGTLTAALAERAPHVAALEVDETLLPVLEYTLADYDNVNIIHADVMKTNLKQLIAEEFGGEKISVAANLPYYITTPILTRLIEERLAVENIVVMVQKEVAERLAAPAGGRERGAISVFAQFYTEPEIIAHVPADSFIPAPKVDSAVVKLAVRKAPAVAVSDEDMFFKTVKAAFSQRRKTLLNCLSSGFAAPKTDMREVLISAGIEPTRRGETLDLEEFAALSERLFQYRRSISEE